MKQISDIVIDIDAIEAHLCNCDFIDKDRTYSYLDLLLSNLKNCLPDLINVSYERGRSIAVSLDSQKNIVTIFGEQIMENEIKSNLEVLGSMKDKPFQVQLWNLFSEAMDYAKRIGKYDEFFKKIN